MHKTTGFIVALLLLSNSVLVPLTANAQTIASTSVTTSTEAVGSMTTTETVQDLATTTPESYSVTLTSYNAVPAQTSPTPWITASGAPSNPEVVAARSRDMAAELPYGTIIAIEGPSPANQGPSCGYNTVQGLIGYRVIADSMAARMRDKIDVQLNQHDTVPVGGEEINPAVALGACKGVMIQVVGYVDPGNIPQTQAALADLVTHDQELAFAKF
jgi:3D (Asp-Asp-Asp) domain-containing protein